MIEWTIRVVRGEWVAETRFWHRRILRRSQRYIERTVLALPPRNLVLTMSLDKPSECVFDVAWEEALLS